MAIESTTYTNIVKLILTIARGHKEHAHPIWLHYAVLLDIADSLRQSGNQAIRQSGINTLIPYNFRD